MDLSRIDGMIAVRLRATGHDRVSVKNTLQECAPSIRPPHEKDKHKWDYYAERTADYAFGYKGDDEISKNQSYIKSWFVLEGRSMPEDEEDDDSGPSM